jgi:hypothetical protein
MVAATCRSSVSGKMVCYKIKRNIFISPASSILIRFPYIMMLPRFNHKILRAEALVFSSSLSGLKAGVICKMAPTVGSDRWAKIRCELFSKKNYNSAF